MPVHNPYHHIPANHRVLVTGRVSREDYKLLLDLFPRSHGIIDRVVAHTFHTVLHELRLLNNATIASTGQPIDIAWSTDCPTVDLLSDILEGCKRRTSSRADRQGASPSPRDVGPGVDGLRQTEQPTPPVSADTKGSIGKGGSLARSGKKETKVKRGEVKGNDGQTGKDARPVNPMDFLYKLAKDSE